jgi:hypothetical protein
MDPLFRPARRIMTVITEAEPRVVQPLLRVGRVEGTPLSSWSGVTSARNFDGQIF